MRKAISMSLLAALLVAVGGAAPTVAQDMRVIDPNQAIDADLAPRAPRPRVPAPAPLPVDTPRYPDAPLPGEPSPALAGTAQAGGDAENGTTRDNAEAIAASSQTFKRQELLVAAEGTFGKGTAGLAGLLEKVLRDQGEPNAYIAGREASGAFVVGLRYGKGMMFHKVEGEQKVFWTGPSVGFDLGGDAAKVFVLVYNLYDSEDLFRRFPAAEGRLYFVGGASATYLRRGNIVLIPIRLGVGWRQGANIGYMKFSHKSKWFPL